MIKNDLGLELKFINTIGITSSKKNIFEDDIVGYKSTSTYEEYKIKNKTSILLIYHC
jgi:hypothetical protein